MLFLTFNSTLQIAGLARKIHDNNTLGEQFTVLAVASKDVIGNQHALVRRVPTRWNSEKDCIDSHVNLRPVVESITGNSANKLGAFKLSEEQWKLTLELKDVLIVSASLCYLPLAPSAHCLLSVIQGTNPSFLSYGVATRM
jgi:hypothetical protein